MTVEYVERQANVRFARTYFLTNLSQNYMKDYSFTEDEDLQETSEIGRDREADTRLLFNVYFSLIVAFRQISEQYLLGAFRDTRDAIQGQAKSVFEKSIISRLNLTENEISRLFKDSEFTVHAIEYNSLGKPVNQTSGENARHNMIMIRMQAKGLASL